MKIIIEQTNNGAVMTVKSPSNEDTKEIKTCFTFGEGEWIEDRNEIDGFISMLFSITYYFSLGYNDRKGLKEAVDVVKIHGDDYECKDKNCEICKDNNK